MNVHLSLDDERHNQNIKKKKKIDYRIDTELDNVESTCLVSADPALRYLTVFLRKGMCFEGQDLLIKNNL